MTTHVMAELRFLRILWDDELEAVHMQWLEPTGGEPFRDGLNRGLGLLMLKGTSKWLADLKWLGMITKADESWMNETWFPRAVDAGLQWLAIISPESSLSTVSVRGLLESQETKLLIEEDRLVTMSFEDVRHARAWLANPGPWNPPG